MASASNRNLLPIAVIAAGVLLAACDSAFKGGSGDEEFETIEWTELIPPEVLEVLTNPPDYLNDIVDGSAEDQISSQFKSTADGDDPYQLALLSTDVNADMDGAMVKLPGFVVPLDLSADQTVTRFLLVPYFGACLHFPPPPPNQIVLVDSPRGLKMGELDDPLWISGRLATSVVESELATSAYSMTLLEYEPYTD